MISALQTKFQKHHKFVFFVLLAVIIVAFVFTIGAAPGIGGETKTSRQDFFGHNLASERDMRGIVESTQTSFRIEHGQTQIDQRQFENYLLERLTLIAMADRLKIPNPTEDQLPEYITTLKAFTNESGKFESQLYNDFIDEIEANPTISTGQVGLILEENFRVAKVRDLLGGPGYILPTEVRLQLERSQTLWSIDLAKYDTSSLELKIEPTDEQLEEFYTENSFRYEHSPRVSFSYVVFDPANYTDQIAEPNKEELATHFERNRPKFTPKTPEKTEEGETPEEKPEVTLDDVRDQVAQSLRVEKAGRVASKSASDFAYALFENKIQPGTEEFEKLVSSFQANVKKAPPASADQFPRELAFPRQVQQEVFRLSDDRHFSDPISLQNTYIILVYHEILPAYVAPIEEVREQVIADYRNEEERRLLAEKADNIHSTLRTKVTNGESFTEAAEEEGLEVTSADSFSRTSAPPEVPPALLGRLEELKKGEISAMIPVQNTGYFVFVRDREVPEIDRHSEEFTSTAQNLSMWSSMANQSIVLQELMERELNPSGN